MESIQTPLRPSTFNSAQEPFASSLAIVRTREPTTILISITHSLSAPLRPTPAEVRNPLRHPLPPNCTPSALCTIPSQHDLCILCTLPNPQTPTLPAVQNGPVQRTPPRPKKKKKREKPSLTKQLDTAAARPLNSSAERSSPFHFPHRGPIIDCSREREREIM